MEWRKAESFFLSFSRHSPGQRAPSAFIPFPLEDFEFLSHFVSAGNLPVFLFFEFSVENSFYWLVFAPP